MRHSPLRALTTLPCGHVGRVVLEGIGNNVLCVARPQLLVLRVNPATSGRLQCLHVYLDVVMGRRNMVAIPYFGSSIVARPQAVHMG